MRVVTPASAVSAAFFLSFVSASSADVIFVDREPKGYASAVHGAIQVLEPEAPGAVFLVDSAPIFEGSRITAGENSFAQIKLVDGSDIDIDELTQMDVSSVSVNVDQEECMRTVELSILYGSLKALAPAGYASRSEFKISTPIATVGVRGTEFSVSYESEDATGIDVYEGEVAVMQEGNEDRSAVEGESWRAERATGPRRAVATENRRERWENVRQTLDLRRKQNREARLRDRLQEIRSRDADDPRIYDLDRELHNAGSDRMVSQEKLETLQERMKSWRQARAEKMRDFAKKHGRAKFEKMRRFRGGKMTAEELEKAEEGLRERRERAKEKAAERREQRREDRREKVKEKRNQDSGEGDGEGGGVRGEKQEKKEKIKERRQEKRKETNQRQKRRIKK